MTSRKTAVRILWWVYLALLLLLVVVKFRGSFSELQLKAEATPFGSNCNLTPFHTLGAQLAHLSEGWAKFNLLGNFLPFVPFGFLLPIVYKKADTYVRTLALGALFVLLIELFQLLTRLGSFDVDDMLLNLAAISAGYLLKRVARR